MKKKPLIEKELKLGLTRKGYETLFELADQKKSKVQENTYFDNPKHALRKGGAGLRIRIENGTKAIITLKCDLKKTRLEAKQGVHSRAEWEARIPVATAQALIQGTRNWTSLRKSHQAQMRAIFPEIEFHSLCKLGTLYTLRSPLRLGRYQGELDYWTAHGKTFYELEVECANPQTARLQIQKQLRKWGVASKSRSFTKLAVLFGPVVRRRHSK
jgi:uncharacterized protein YjbK